MCLDFLYNYCIKYLHSKKNSKRFWHKGTTVCHVKYTLFFSNVQKIEISRHIFQKKLKNAMTIRPVGAEWFHADMMTLNSRFSQFYERVSRFHSNRPRSWYLNILKPSSNAPRLVQESGSHLQNRGARGAIETISILMMGPWPIIYSAI